MAQIRHGDRTACHHFICNAPDPRHLILWKCQNGHRMERWYCDDCIAAMMEIAVACLAGGWSGTLICECLVPHLPVLEGREFPAMQA